MSNEALKQLMSTGVPSAKFHTIGTTVSGKVTHFERTQQRDLDGNLKTWDDGGPMWQFVFTVETEDRDPAIEDDDGTRKIYAKAQMERAIRAAIKASGHQGDIEGGILHVRYSGDGVKTKAAFNAPKEYEAKFEPPKQTDAFDDEPPLDDMSEPF